MPTKTKLPAVALLLAAGLALASCAGSGAGAPAANAAAEPVSHQQAATYCWMKTERGPAMSLDKRADVVDRCIKARMHGG